MGHAIEEHPQLARLIAIEVQIFLYAMNLNMYPREPLIVRREYQLILSHDIDLILVTLLQTNGIVQYLVFGWIKCRY